jgi:hypothetical protein
VLKQVQKHRVGRITAKQVLVSVLACRCAIKHVAKQILAQILKQVILGFKVSVKGCPAYVGKVYYFSYGNFVVVLGRK